LTNATLQNDAEKVLFLPLPQMAVEVMVAV